MNHELYRYMQNKLNSYAQFFGEIHQIAKNQQGTVEDFRQAVIDAMRRHVERGEQCDSSEK